MGFLGNAVIVVAMALIALSAGALGYLMVGLRLDVSGVLAAATFAILLVVQFLRWRAADAARTSRDMTEVGVAFDRLSREVAVLSNRLGALEASGAAGAARDVQGLRAAIDGLDERLVEVSAIVVRNGEAIAELARAPEPRQIVDQQRMPDPVEAATAPRRGGRFAGLPIAELVATVAQALEAGRLEIMLQPIVTLPQRKIRAYELTVNLRTDRGEVLLPDDYAAAVDQGGLGARFDSDVLFRAVRILRRLQARNREVSIVLNLSGGTLSAGEAFAEFSDFVKANAAIAGSLVFEIPQSAYRAFGPIEFESMAAIASHGARFGLDKARDLRLDPKDLADRGFRFVKVPAEVVLGRSGQLPLDIHTADLADLLARYGVDLVAIGIDTESTVVDLLDYDMRFGQGVLFSPPRPVRADLLADAPAERRAAS